MRGIPTITPLDAAETLYSLRDEDGTLVGTGTREVCEVLLFIMMRCHDQENAGSPVPCVRQERPNLRAAIAI